MNSLKNEKSQIKIDSNNLENFKKKYFKDLSPYFNETFAETITSIAVQHISDRSDLFIANAILNEKCANLFKIAHGGALTTLIENLSDVSLRYFKNINSRTTDININFLKQTELNKNIRIKLTSEKMGYVTFYVEVQIHDEKDELCCQASIIKTKVNNAKF